jgi:hypothetical protein
MSYIRTAYYDGSNWIDVGGTASGNIATTGTITSNSVSSFNLFTFGSSAFLLPLHILSFTAQHLNTSTQVSWITSDEENVNRFEVQRSDDGNNFYTVINVAARNRGITENYSATDKLDIHRVAYYRLRSIDTDGRSRYSQVVIISEINSNSDLKLVINPVHEQIVLSAGSQISGSFHYKINAQAGQLLLHGNLLIQHGGLYSISLPSNILPGVYILKVSDLHTKFNYRVLIK